MLVVILALMICTPLVYAANATYVLKDTLSSIFPGDDKSGAAINASNPWKNRPRINVLLLGGDGGKDRTGIRTDSMTVASIDTHDFVTVANPRWLEVTGDFNVRGGIKTEVRVTHGKRPDV